MSALAQPKRTLALPSCTPCRHGPQNIFKCWAGICAATPPPLHQKAAQREYGEPGLWCRLALGCQSWCSWCFSFLQAPCLSVFPCIKWGGDNNTSHRTVWWLNKSMHVKFSVRGQVGRKYSIMLGPKPFLPDRKAMASLPMVCNAASHSPLLLAIPLQLCGIFLQNTTRSVHLPSSVLPCYCVLYPFSFPDSKTHEGRELCASFVRRNIGEQYWDFSGDRMGWCRINFV